MKNTVYGEAPLFQVRFQKACIWVVDKSPVAEGNCACNAQMHLQQIGGRCINTVLGNLKVKRQPFSLGLPGSFLSNFGWKQEASPFFFF